MNRHGLGFAAHAGSVASLLDPAYMQGGIKERSDGCTCGGVVVGMTADGMRRSCITH